MGNTFARKLCLMIFINALAFTPAMGQSDSIRNAIISSKDDTNKVNKLNLLCWNEINNGNYERARPDVETAYSIAEKLGYKKGMAYALLNKGGIYQFQGKYPQALEHKLRSLKLYEEIGNNSGIASCNNDIGLIYFHLKEFEQALKYYQKGYEVRVKMNDPGGIAVALNNIGIVYQNQGKSDMALEYYSKALKKYEEANNPRGAAKAHNNIGSVYSSLKEYSRALEYFLYALEFSEKAGDLYSSALLHVNVGGSYQTLGQYAEAIRYLEKAQKLSGEIGTLDLTKSIHQALSEVYNESGKPALALKHYKEYIAIRDSLFNEENTKKLVQAEMTFEFERKEQAAKLEQEKKDAVANERFKRQQLMTWTFAGSGGLVLLFGLVLLRGYRQKQKAHRIITAQKKEVEHQKDLVEEKNKEILDSIYYAKRIQQAMLPFEESISSLLKELFIFYKPKDIVSGDFYWFMEKEGKCIIAAVDCTGHGVPGAFMSMIGNDLLNDIVGNRSITDPGRILTELNKGIRSVLKQDETSSRDGMDISLCTIDSRSRILQYAGANNPIWIIGHDKIFRELKPVKAAIGGHTAPNQEYAAIQLELNSGDMVYLFTDGFADQFGGPKGKKFKYKPMQELLLANSGRPPGEQKEEIAKVFESWKGSLEQTDDVTVIGVRL